MTPAYTDAGTYTLFIYLKDDMPNYNTYYVTAIITLGKDSPKTNSSSSSKVIKSNITLASNVTTTMTNNSSNTSS
jgi:hypothetical protein